MKQITLGQGKSRRKYVLLLDDPVDGSIDCPQQSFGLYVDPRMKGKRNHLETCIHEVVHGECPGMPEDRVERIGHAVARLLWGIGYRLNSD